MRRNTVLGVLCLLLIGLPSAGSAEPRWGEFKRDSCTSVHNRQYSAILWDIPWGQDWETVCSNTGATIGDRQFERPTRCKETGGHMWGEFDVPDATCMPHWGEFTDDGCLAADTCQYSSILWDIPSGLAWEEACRQTPASFGGYDFDRPTRCVNHAGHMWGEFDVADSGCS